MNDNEKMIGLVMDKAIEIQTQIEVYEKQKECLEEKITRLLNTPLNEY